MAYIIEQHHLCGPGARDPFALQMEWLVSDHSIYCRENALYALYAGGQPEHVIKAYHILTRMRIEHSSKMVTDGLLSFQGDRELLAEELWKNWTHYSTYYKICFVNFFRMISGNFTERLLIVLKDEENDRELRLAVIRYFESISMTRCGNICAVWLRSGVNQIGNMLRLVHWPLNRIQGKGL